MIILDGNVYRTYQVNYVHKQDKFADTQRGLTGVPLRVESGAFQNEYTPTLLVAIADITNLRASLAKTSTVGTPPPNRLNFVDEEGIQWNPAASGTGHLNTGVYFTTMSDPKPLTAKGWRSDNLFTVQITLLVNSSGLSS